MPKAEKNYWEKTMENIILHLKLARGVRGVTMAYVVWQHIKVANISPRYSDYLNLDEEMIATAPIVNMKSNLKLT